MTLRVHPDEIVAGSSSDLLAVHPSWERVRLGEVAAVLNGLAFRSTQFSKTDGVPLLRIRDVGKAATDVRFVGDFDPAYLIRSGDQVIGMDGEFRTARWTGADALLNQRVCKVDVRDPSQYDRDFLLYALPGYLSAINQQTSAITVKHLSSRTVADIPLPLPPLAEQRRIVAAIEEQLSRLDVADDCLARARTRLASLRAGALAGVFSTKAPLVAVPEAAEIVSGQTPKGLIPSDAGPVPFFKVGDMNAAEGYEMAASRAYISHELVERFRLKVRPAGTVIFPKRGGAIATNKKRILRTPAVFDLNTMGLVPGPRLLPKYLLYWMETIDLGVLADGSNVPQINVPDIASLRLSLPEIDEQHRAVSEIELQLSVIDAMAGAIEAAERRSVALRRSILERAFRGELVPQDPSDEPASVLLERIRAERAAQPKPRRTRRAGSAQSS